MLSSLKNAFVSRLRVRRLDSAFENGSSVSGPVCPPGRVFRVLGVDAFRLRFCVYRLAAPAADGGRAFGGWCVFENARPACAGGGPRLSLCDLLSRLGGLRVFVRVLVVAFGVLLGVLLIANLCRRLVAAEIFENSLRFCACCVRFFSLKFLN